MIGVANLTRVAKRWLWLWLLALVGTAAGCAQQAAERPQASASVADDDAYCQAKGFKPGSDVYVNCRRDRDSVAGMQAQQDKRDIRKMQDYMMDHH
jgi:hypothetical protein